MVSSEARIVRLEPGESLARYASTGFSSRGRPSPASPGITRMAGAPAGAPSPTDGSESRAVAIDPWCSLSATLGPDPLFGSENCPSHNINCAKWEDCGQGDGRVRLVHEHYEPDVPL